MTHKVKLKNSKEVVLFDDKGYKYLTTDPYLVKVDFINNLRRHSSGCAVFQKSVTTLEIYTSHMLLSNCRQAIILWQTLLE